MPIIDVHTHMFTRHWLELLRAHGDPYGVVVRPDGRDEIYRGPTPVVFPQPGHFDYDLRIQAMDAAGIDVSIVSLTCPNVYWGGEDISCEAARESNATMAAAQTTYRDRIRWFASLPWEYPDRAVAELQRSCDEGAVGVMVIANIAGRSLTEPAFEPIWSEIDRRALPVLVHPGEPPGSDFMDMGSYDLSWLVGFMFDTTLAIERMIFDGFLDRFPNLKLIAAHGGGALPYLVGRMRKGNEVELPSRRRMLLEPIDYLRRIWYDCITYDPGALRYLISVVGAERVLFGTDWPHQVHDVVGSLANTAALPPDQRDAIRGTSALELFRL
ncbi:MAG TPA: amidohydrolase family protein [Candidatus Limnocylindrales bacterium]|nr:amidohydrolase family protein [Candidatus Limnocylindrales bacterium]